MARTSARRWFPAVPAAETAAGTPADRDRVVDGVRAAALLIVVLGHCLMAVVAWPDGVPVVGNVLAAHPGTQLLTWGLQVMPWFFMAGGVANARSWERHAGDGTTVWLWGRAARLLRPMWPYLAFMSAVAALVTALAPTRVAAPLLLLVTQLLWFIGAYLLVTALTPLFMRWTARPLPSVSALLMAVAGVDLVRFALGWPEALGLVNFVLVWAVPAFLGTLRARGALAMRRPMAWLGALLALGCEATLVATGPYPLSLVGMPGDPVSNMAPPTLVLALHSVALALIVTACDASLTRLLHRPNVWLQVTRVNLVAMTLYLWHLPVLVGLTCAVHALGIDRPTRLASSGYPEADGIPYILGSVPFILAFLVCVAGAVRILWPLEHMALLFWDSPTRWRKVRPRVAAVAAWTGAAGVGIATLALSATGLGGFPSRVVHYAGVPLTAAGAMAVLVASGLLLRWAGAPRASDGGNSGAPHE